LRPKPPGAPCLRRARAPGGRQNYNVGLAPMRRRKPPAAHFRDCECSLPSRVFAPMTRNHVGGWTSAGQLRAAKRKRARNAPGKGAKVTCPASPLSSFFSCGEFLLTLRNPRSRRLGRSPSVRGACADDGSGECPKRSRGATTQKSSVIPGGLLCRVRAT